MCGLCRQQNNLFTNTVRTVTLYSLTYLLRGCTALLEPWHLQLRTPILPYLLPSVATTFVSRRAFSAYSSHLNLGLQLPLLPSGLLPNIFLTDFPWSILTTCPIHSSLFLLISATMSRSLYSSLNSWLVLIFLISCSNTGQCTLPLLIFSALMQPVLS